MYNIHFEMNIHSNIQIAGCGIIGISQNSGGADGIQ
jgi:hypothetical protein